MIMSSTNKCMTSAWDGRTGGTTQTSPARLLHRARLGDMIGFSFFFLLFLPILVAPLPEGTTSELISVIHRQTCRWSVWKRSLGGGGVPPSLLPTFFSDQTTEHRPTSGSSQVHRLLVLPQMRVRSADGDSRRSHPFSCFRDDNGFSMRGHYGGRRNKRFQIWGSLDFPCLLDWYWYWYW